MKLKTLVCATLSVALLAGTALASPMVNPEGDKPEAVPVIAPLPNADKEAFTIGQQKRLQPVMIYGKATEIGENRVLVENSNDKDVNQKVMVLFSENTYIVDAVSGERKAFKDLKNNETLYAYVGPAMTRSMPPQATATLVICNIPADFGVPTFAEVSQVATKEDGSISALMSGDIILHMNKDTKLLTTGTRNMPGLSDIYPGVRLLSWYNFAAMSFPAQATPTQVMIFPSSFDGYAAMDGESLTVNGQAVTLAEGQKPQVSDGKLLLPLRAFAEAAGCQVLWNAETPNEVTISKNDTPVYTITLGAEAAKVGEETLALSVPGAAVNGVTFLEANDLLNLHNMKLAAH